MDERTLLVMTAEDFKKAIKETLAREVEERIYNRFEGIAINAKTACHILKISNPTMHSYIKGGYLVPEDRVSGGDIYFSLAQILRFDKPEVQKLIRYGF